MPNKRLSQAEVAKRMVRLRNLEKLHRVSKQRRTAQDLLIANLQEMVERQQELIEKQDEFIATQAIRIAELESMVFGKKKQPPMGGMPISAPDLFAAKKVPRTRDSYHRPIPPATAITEEVVAPLPATCAHCGSSGSFDPDSVITHDRFVEDIPLPELTPGYQAQLVTKYGIERGVCLACGKATTGNNTALGGARVSLGPNVRLLVTHLVSLVGLSYAQVANLILSLYGLTITDGEIARILHKQHQSWLPAYTQLGTDIRAAPAAHADETSWPIQSLQGAGYAWDICDTASPKVCFVLASSRGAPHAKALFGQDSNQPFAGVRITDDYGAYRGESLPGSQQLCWVHLYRSIRDLRYNNNLPKAQLPYVTQWYEQFAAIYQDLRLYLDEPYDLVVRNTQATELWQRLQALADQPAPKTGEPDKLTRLKAQLTRAGQDRLFVCLPKDTPCDNNRAERDLRQLVLKRKRSFGSKTEKGAQALATILSLCTTTWRTNPTAYFQQLALLG